ncbi:hypothetical protein DN392_26825 [Bacillus sp. BB51/4]|uniref:coiled-coil domain-containing protein n=1 Tax=Bacillus sp. BB51/4 TaxID=2217819 RepID=UPI0011EC537D|nr:hypothetical protein [Bacillus sp. BB51/4]KAA0769169.1 hypothetical protein DN392_26825 [Bacillus sp. BB51/4]
MLGILFTATVSNDVVRDLQDKVISIQDHEISFLNGTIAIWAAGTGILVAIALTFIGVTNSKAQKKMEDANTKMSDATEKLKDAEKKISDLESKISEANQAVSQAQKIADSAQEKLDELENAQKELKKFTSLLDSRQQVDAMLAAVKFKLDSIKDLINEVSTTIDLKVFTGKYDDLWLKYTEIHKYVLQHIVNGERIPKERGLEIVELNKQANKLLKEYFGDK